MHANKFRPVDSVETMALAISRLKRAFAGWIAFACAEHAAVALNRSFCSPTTATALSAIFTGCLRNTKKERRVARPLYARHPV